MRKHRFWPVPSYGLLEAYSTRLVKGGESLDERSLSFQDNSVRNRWQEKESAQVEPRVSLVTLGVSDTPLLLLLVALCILKRDSH